jgi:serine/threonine protein kinase
MRDDYELPGGEPPPTPTEDRLGRFLEEAMNLAQGGRTIDVAALLADRPDLIDRGRRLVEGLKSFHRAAGTTSFHPGPAPAPAPGQAPLPDPFPGEFRIRRLLGQGTFGKVWLADDLHLGRQVALKTLHLPAAADPSALEALRKEANFLAGLDHRNVVRVHAWRKAGGDHYLVLEYVPGGSLADLLKEVGPLTWQRAARYVAGVAEGLREVHAHGIIHRDIKASNILWDPARDEAKLTDFGVAGRLGATRTAVGTPVFMAPEALRGQATEASDVYGLAATLFHLTTGELPFPALAHEEADASASRGLPPADDRFRRVPQRLEGIIRAGLAPAQADRPSMQTFADALAAILDAPAGPLLTLRVEGSPYAYRPAPGQDIVTVGRQKRRPGDPPDTGNDLVVRVPGDDERSTRISRRHLEVHRTPDGFAAIDRSKAGTLLNGRPLPRDVPTPLGAGDRLVLAGVATLEVVIEGGHRAAPTFAEVAHGGGAGRVVFEAILGDLVTAD